MNNQTKELKLPQLLPSEVVFDFAAFISTLDGTIKVGKQHNAAMLADLCGQYCKQEGFEPPREHFEKLLRGRP